MFQNGNKIYTNKKRSKLSEMARKICQNDILNFVNPPPEPPTFLVHIIKIKNVPNCLKLHQNAS